MTSFSRFLYFKLQFMSTNKLQLFVIHIQFNSILIISEVFTSPRFAAFDHSSKIIAF